MVITDLRVRNLGGAQFAEGKIDGAQVSLPIIGRLSSEATRSPFAALVLNGINKQEVIGWGPYHADKGVCVLTTGPLNLGSSEFGRLVEEMLQNIS